MTENPDLESEGSCDGGGWDGRKTTSGATPVSVSDAMKVHGPIPYAANFKPDCFVIDLQSFSHGHGHGNGPNQDATQSPRLKMQRSFSRKGSQRGKKKLNSNASGSGGGPERERDGDPQLIAASSPRALVETSMPEKEMFVGPQSGSLKVHHQIAITTAAESRLGLRRNSFKRPPPPWLLDPRRILFLFATLSSMGTILLIFFTLTSSNMNGEDSPHDPQT